ncbi:ornithine carbamoyltransferase [Caldivirga sp. UBA161]|uniref:ornithine carbamoyltransferase n=1 Tax=Caldivirga sp. UBA161 TaxID=1915569 RepID=UPI0025B8CBEF|nr:ornithine carbamoyltransferase [Caldivirga sp. UBA161]
MLNQLKGRSLLSWLDYTPQEVLMLLNLSKNMKERYYLGERYIGVHQGKAVLMIFEKPSTRTRISFETAAWQLGMKAIYSNPQELQLGRGETIEDTARVVSRIVDGIVARVFDHSTLIKLTQYSQVPVVNALSNECHPTQVLADALTLWEVKGKVNGVKLAFVGDGDNNMAHSLIAIGARLGWDVRVVSPKRYWPSRRYVEDAEDLGKRTGAVLTVTESIEEGVKGVDAVYTDVWVSMGMEKEAEERIRLFKPYQVNQGLMSIAGEDAVFMHCLPAHRGLEVTDDVIDSPRSIVWQQAENRLHTAKAILAALIR